MDLFAFINHANLTKVRIGKREVADREVPLLQLTRGRVVSFASVNDQGDVNAQGVGNDDVNEEGNDVVEAYQTEQGDHVVRVGGIDIVSDDEAQTIVADKSKRIRKKRKAVDGAGGYGLPPKKLREYHSASGDAGASTAGKSLVVLQGLLDSCTLAADVGLTTAATVPFVTSSMIPHTGVTHAADDEVTSIVRSSMPPPPVLTAVVATTIIANVTFAPAPMTGTGQDAEAAEAIRHGVQVVVVEVAEAARIAELNGLKEHAATLGGWVASLDSTAVAKDAELSSVTANTAQVTHDLSSLKTSFGEVTIKAASLESEKDDLVGQVSALETTYFGLREQVSGYELFKEQIEDVQNEQVKIPSDKVAGIGVDLMKMALHLDEEFYPCFLTTIAGRRDGRDLAEVAAYNPVAEADYVSVVSALCDVDFPLLAQLASHKDASMSDLMDLLHLEGDATARHLSLSDAMIPLTEPLFAENLIGEASTSEVSATATTSALSTTCIHTSSVPSVSVVDYEFLDVGPSTKVPSLPTIVF
nr:hypothetical protein [Tanacetum cinerariifolium]